MSTGPKTSRGPVIPRQPTLVQRLLGCGVHWLIRGIAWTCRLELVDPHGAVSLVHRERVIFVIWHNRLAFSMIIHRRYMCPKVDGRRIAALVSASRDGAFLASILTAFGAEPVRGSSSRRGAQALVEMRSALERGLHLAITPDGPRGPCYRAQSGVVSLAKVTGAWIVPVSLNTRWRVNLRSWDRFQVPLPFGACRVEVGEPMRVPASDDAAVEAARMELESRLRSITRD